MVIGIPALITALPADEVVTGLGMQIMLASSLMLFVIGLARQVMRWEGAMLLLFFGFFLVKLMAYIQM